MGGWQSSSSNSDTHGDESIENVKELDELEADPVNDHEEKYKQSIIKYAPCLDFSYAMSLMLKLKLNPVTIITQLNTQEFDLSNDKEMIIFTNYNCIDECFPFLRMYIGDENTRCINRNSQVLSTSQIWPNDGLLLIRVDKAFADHLLAVYQSIIHQKFMNSLEEIDN